MTVKVLFVCLGNICRSPMAEGVFKKHLDQVGWGESFSVDSAGTSGFHIGENPDQRMCETALQYSIELDHKARQFLAEDFERFDYIVAMDRANLRDIKSLSNSPIHLQKVHLMRDFDTGFEGQEVPDPYYGGLDGFHEVYRILDRSADGFLKFLKHRQPNLK